MDLIPKAYILSFTRASRSRVCIGLAHRRSLHLAATDWIGGEDFDQLVDQMTVEVEGLRLSRSVDRLLPKGTLWRWMPIHRLEGRPLHRIEWIVVTDFAEKRRYLSPDRGFETRKAALEHFHGVLDTYRLKRKPKS